MVHGELTDVFTTVDAQKYIEENPGGGVVYNMFLDISLERQQKEK